MRQWTHTLAATMVLLAAAGGPARAQIDLASVLVGRWEGDIQMARGTYPRTLIVKSVQIAAGKAAVDAEYGGTGTDYGWQAPRMAPVAVTLEAYGSDVILKFVSPEGLPIELSLSPDRRHLYGDLRISVALGGSRPINPIRLARVG